MPLIQGRIAIRPYFGDAYFRKPLYLIMIKIRKNKILYFAILPIISFLVCGCTSQEKKNSYEDSPIVNFDRDSVFYRLNIKEDGEWYVFSTEELKIDYTKKLSYCIDSFSCIPAKYYNTEETMYDNCLDCDNN